MRVCRHTLWVLCAALSGCTGIMAMPSGPRGGSTDDVDPGSSDASSACSGDIDPGPRPLLRLSREQYLTSVHDLVGDVPGLDAALGPAVSSSELGLIQADVSQLDLERYQSAADVVAAHIAATVPCTTDDKRSCAKTFLADF